MKRTSGAYQYEPLIMPEGWKDEERRFVIRLTALLDELFSRVGRMEKQLGALENKLKGEGEDGADADDGRY